MNAWRDIHNSPEARERAGLVRAGQVDQVYNRVVSKEDGNPSYARLAR